MFSHCEESHVEIWKVIYVHCSVMDWQGKRGINSSPRFEIATRALRAVRGRAIQSVQSRSFGVTGLLVDSLPAQMRRLCIGGFLLHMWILIVRSCIVHRERQKAREGNTS